MNIVIPPVEGQQTILIKTDNGLQRVLVPNYSEPFKEGNKNENLNR